MEKLYALRFLFCMLETAYCKQKDLFGPAFNRDFIVSFATLYSDLARRQYLKAVAIIGNYKFRNKMINLMDSMPHDEGLQSGICQDDLLPIETALMQFFWVLRRFSENDKIITESLLRKGKEILTKKEYDMLVKLASETS